MIITKTYETCPQCEGKGRVEHNCFDRGGNIKKLAFSKLIWESGGESRTEKLVIQMCATCNMIYKIRDQFGPEGSDCIILKIGEEERGYTFTQEEAGVALDEYISKRTFEDISDHNKPIRW
jgi:hypothetical protein